MKQAWLGLGLVAATMVGCGRGERAAPGRDRETAGAMGTTADAGDPDAGVRASPGTERTIGAPVAAGSLVGDEVYDGYRVLVRTVADARRAQRAAQARLDVQGGDTADLVVPPQHLPDPGLLATIGVGLDARDVAALGRAGAEVEIRIAYDATAPAARATSPRRAADAARVAALAGRGWVFDLPRYRMYSAASFAADHAEGFDPEVRRLIAWHQVTDQRGGVFLESFGMVRFGLPELYLPGVPATFAEDVGVMVNAAAQTLVERGGVTRDGELDVDLAALASPSWRPAAEAARRAGGSGRVRFTVRWSHGDAPDGPAELELGVDGASTPEALAAARRDFFGVAADEILWTSSDSSEIEAASARAKVELAALAPHFAHGIPDGERLAVKAPFPTDHGRQEWMWVEVASWHGPTLRGILTNQPDDIAVLHEGSEVVVQQGDVFDYLHRHADGTTSGGAAEAIIERELERQHRQQ